MSMSDCEFEEIDLNETPKGSAGQKLKRLRNKIASPKKINIPLLNKNTADPNTFVYEDLLRQINIISPHRLDSNFVKTPSPKNNGKETVERLLFNHQLSENRKRFLRNEKEINELKTCTFSPKIHSSSKKIFKSRSGKGKDNQIFATNVNISKLKPKIENLLKPSNLNWAKSHSVGRSEPVTQSTTPRSEKVPLDRKPPIPKYKLHK
jgi:hypothetical protein